MSSLDHSASIFGFVLASKMEPSEMETILEVLSS